MIKANEIWGRMVPWLSHEGMHSDVVIASRIRIARNIKDLPFPNHAPDKKLSQVLQLVSDTTEELELPSETLFWRLNQINQNERLLLSERRLISPEFIQPIHNRAVMFDKNGRISIMVNEEDHIRLQVLDSGMDMEYLWDEIHQIDRQLGKKLSFAFSYEFGYLTSCPTNTGTGLRISMLMFLPALEAAQNLESVFSSYTPSGVMVRGFYGEGSDVIGSIFQISNKLTLGWTEFRLMEDLLKIASEIVDKEQEARSKLIENRDIEVEDKIFRSLGIFERARKISSTEFIEHYSNIMLGTIIGLIPEIEPQALHELILWVQPTHLQYQYGSDLSPMERDIYRAEMIRTRLGL